MDGWLQASLEADQAYQAFGATKDSADAETATIAFNDAKERLQNAARLLPEGRKIVELHPTTIPYQQVYDVLAKVGLGAEKTEMTKLVISVKELETELGKAKAEIQALKLRLGE